MKTEGRLVLTVLCFIVWAPVTCAQDVVTEPLVTFSGHTEMVSSVAFSPDGSYVLTGSGDYTARLWGAATGEHLETFGGHTGGVTSVAFSPDGAAVLTGSGDKTARLWSISTGEQILLISGHEARVRAVAFSPDGTRILTGSHDNSARLWGASAGDAIFTFPHATTVWSVAFSPDGTKVLTGSDDSIARLWDATTGLYIRSFLGHTLPVRSVAFSPDGTKVLTGSIDKTAKLWDAATGSCIRTFNGHTGEVWSVAFSPNGGMVLAGVSHEPARLLDATTGELLRTFKGDDTFVYSVAFSPDGTKVLTGSDRKIARLWSTGPQLQISSSPITAVTISGDVPGTTDFSQILTEASQGVTLCAPSVALSGDARYDFIRWEIDGQEQPQGQTSVQFIVDHSMTALAVYEIRKHTLAVESAPVTGVSIAGKLTNHTLTVDDQQTVDLIAPALASVNGVDYGFIRWVVDGLEQPIGQASFSLLMDADRMATAVYFRAARLSVTSSPYSGIYIPGSPAGTTPYEQIYLAAQGVSLSAQLRLFSGSVPFNLAYWTINGIAQQPRQTDIQFRVEADTIVEAVYNILGDANGDCVVNVLDLIAIRNRLGKPTGTGDNWRGDVNLDSSVDVLDLISTRNKLGTRCQ